MIYDPRPIFLLFLIPAMGVTFIYYVVLNNKDNPRDRTHLFLSCWIALFFFHFIIQILYNILTKLIMQKPILDILASEISEFPDVLRMILWIDIISAVGVFGSIYFCSLIIFSLKKFIYCIKHRHKSNKKLFFNIGIFITKYLKSPEFYFNLPILIIFSGYSFYDVLFTDHFSRYLINTGMIYYYIYQICIKRQSHLDTKSVTTFAWTYVFFAVLPYTYTFFTENDYSQYSIWECFIYIYGRFGTEFLNCTIYFIFINFVVTLLAKLRTTLSKYKI